MERPSKNLRPPTGVSDEELEQEIQEAFSEPLLPSRPSLAAGLKVVRPPATTEDLTRVLAAWGNALPASYLDFLRESDGGEACGSDDEGDYLTLWRCSELIERNASMPLRERLPALLAIGTDGRGGWVGFHRVKSQEAERSPVVRFDSGSSRPANVRELAPSFREWRKGGFQLRSGGCICDGG
jgi:hypothetical protein